MTDAKVVLIDEIRGLTAEMVAKMNDASRLNFPKIVEKIREQAKRGLSFCKFLEKDINEYDKKLLEQEGFRVRLVESTTKNEYLMQSMGVRSKMWEVSW